jgi:hypothetical protein
VGAFEEILLAGLIALGGSPPPDLVSLVDDRDYFKARGVVVSLERMTELAGKGPADGRAPVAQLLALRWLGERPEEVRKSRAAREVLEQVAAGKKGKDGQGFARDYALRALARLDGKVAPASTLPDSSLRGEALAWFPAEGRIIGGIDFRHPKAGAGPEGDAPYRSLLAALPAQGRKEIYDFADAVGNFRLDRISFAVVPDADDRKTRQYVRMTGLVSHKHLAAYFRKMGGRTKVEALEGGTGPPLTLIEPGSGGALMALVGDTDILLAGHMGPTLGEDRAGLRRIMQEALLARAGKKASAVKGPLAARLASSPAQATALLLADLPERWRADMAHTGGPFRAVPRRLDLSAVRTARGLEVRLRAAAVTAAEARAFADSVAKLTASASDALSRGPLLPRMGAGTVEKVRAALAGVQVQAEGALLRGRAFVSPEVGRALATLLQAAVMPVPER